MKAPEPPPVPLQDVLNAYANGYFPMGDSYGELGVMNWHNPPERAVMPIRLHVPRKLRGLALQNDFEIRIDTAFADVMAGCMEGREYQWITGDIRKIFNALHQAGHAHSIECWQDDQLVGGIYGLALGQAFCAESMFSRVTGASKIALIHLCARLEKGGFSLLDCQILNDHTEQFGAYDIPRMEYLKRLHLAIRGPADFFLQSGACEQDEKALVRDFLLMPKL